MSKDAGPAAELKDRCHYPGCSRASRPDPDTGRPTRYCEQSDPEGGPPHNRANAWRARRAQRGGALMQEEAAPASVSMARVTLEQRLTEFPAKFGELREYLDGILAGVRAAGDVEAAGAEVEDAHREALTKVNEAERRAGSAERVARLAEQRASVAEREREEADALAEEALAETARVREELQAEVAQIRADADIAVARAREELAASEAEHRNRLTERDAEVERARQEANSAQVNAASARAAQKAADEAAMRDRETAAQLHRELEQVRADGRSEREALRAAHAEQLDQMQRSGDERATALNQALSLARETAETYRAQLSEVRSQPTSTRKHPPRG